ncbi:condensation domain-containing protein [Phytohabitans sp. ZYX-F-186]|uniref:Condensation domain-containing protein n=1 Tax=Phytohabitans maris TaxID=3071409 RepID=A0ABU0ZV00_9ACTN|nr:condensation domain-containing protein [Phytohabitans sp. ZYX-F-186]MDQ7910871.1 condensation domain-containing protein [Phytohabitans sp. ZYX-F-186]
MRFEGGGSGVEELSWGQRELWEAMRRQLTWMPMGYALPVPPGTTVDDAVAQLRFMMGRYQSMRTRVRRDPDGRDRQVVAASGEIDLEVVDAADGEDPAAVAESVRQRFCAADHDFARDWPVRMAVVRHHGVPTHQVVILCHLVTDGFGALVIMREIGDRDLVHGRTPAPPVTTLEPMAQARWEASPAGQREHAAVLRRWEAVLRTIPARRFPGPADPREPRHWQVRLDSPATLLAVRAIRARTTVDTSTILLALFAAAWARVSGTDPVVTRVVAHNRFRRGLAETVSPITHTGLCVIPLDGGTFDETLSTVHRRAMAAYRYAYYDPRALDTLVARVAAERGEELDLSCFFNDRRLVTRDLTEAPPPADPAEVTAALSRSRLRWHSQDKPVERLFATINDEPDTLDYELLADSHHVAPADLAACVRGMEALAVAAAFDPSVRVLEKVAT